MTRKYTDDIPDIGAPTKDQTGRHLSDQQLRERGFEIAIRNRKAGITRWSRNGQELTQQEAEKIAYQERKALVEAKEHK